MNRLFAEEVVAGIPENDLKIFVSTLQKIQHNVEANKDTQ